MYYQLPLLYTIDAKGKERIWSVSVEENTIYRETGLVDGKRINSERSFNGKNIGRSNETTPEEQAMQEAEKEWVKQLEKNYAPRCKEGKKMYDRVMKTKNESGGHNINASAQLRGRKTKNVAKRSSFAVPKVDIDVRPMKAEKWELEDEKDIYSVKAKVLKNMDIEKGVYCQPKYDGWRCIARWQSSDNSEGGGSVVLTSLSSKQYPWFGNLRTELATLFSKHPDVILDGELYAHSIECDDPSLITSKEGKEMDNFGIIQSICTISSKTPHPLEDQIKFHVFDIVDLTGKLDQKSRFRIMQEIFDSTSFEYIVKTPFKNASSIDDIIKNLDHFVDKGYEGLIIRARNNFYKTKGRSLQMRKLKYFTDKEFTIVDADLDYGVSEENFVWICRDEEGNEVRAKPKGSVESRRSMYNSKEEYIGKLATIKLQNYSGNGIPRFPIFKGVRHPADYLPE